jgi:hypothetical protein
MEQFDVHIPLQDVAGSVWIRVKPIVSHGRAIPAKGRLQVNPSLTIAN